MELGFRVISKGKGELGWNKQEVYELRANTEKGFGNSQLWEYTMENERLVLHRWS